MKLTKQQQKSNLQSLKATLSQLKSLSILYLPELTTKKKVFLVPRTFSTNKNTNICIKLKTKARTEMKFTGTLSTMCHLGDKQYLHAAQWRRYDPWDGSVRQV